MAGSEPALEARQIELESRLLHQEKLLEQLSVIVTSQQVLLERLRLDVSRLKAQVLAGRAPEIDESPPHY